MRIQELHAEKMNRNMITVGKVLADELSEPQKAEARRIAAIRLREMA